VIERRGLHHLDAYVNSSPNVRTNANLSSNKSLMLVIEHPCNVKEIKVLAGTTEDHMSEVLHVGLKNDTIPETFSLQYVNNAGVCIPTQFIKLMPMLSVLVLSTSIHC
jgi:muskelin-like protein